MRQGVESLPLRYSPILPSEAETQFSVIKEALYSHVEAVFGWDDEFQRQRINNDYQPDWFYWIHDQDERVGLVCYKPYQQAYHVHLLIVFPQYQNRKLGYRVMRDIQALALKEERGTITLSSFRRNQQAIAFYQRLGYQITDDSEADFVSLALRVIE
ncbi:GNAT family N-acetyltransferase [Vibrio sp. D404a]|uniref:GNAT family N-acetyltransferase n=1 Tax=unclassified Vibrio TaxID=2614977 RepID=UPI0025548F26|nr:MULTISPECIES: GNAT family N-acetyltransferase [unclassified Vibrio]MDK9738759.1 GNAT family N-acetyltransferase [Vibrio sp. D404a]MDK9798466.1 GNAT family N-acetyltransferase [Vibrio sp. D449a]